MSKSFDIETLTQPGGLVPVNIETTAALVREVLRLRAALKGEQMWALAIKTKLGDTWHQPAYGGRDRPVARCNCMIRLTPSSMTDSPEGHRCERCLDRFLGKEKN